MQFIRQRLMAPKGRPDRRKFPALRLFCSLVCVFVLQPAVYAQSGGPFDQAVSTLTSFVTGPLARGASLIAIVCGGLALAFQEHGSKRTLAGIVFGVGLAVGAANLMTWLFPG